MEKKGRYTIVNLIFEKKLILRKNLRKKTRKFEGTNGQYTSVNLIFDKKCG